MNNRRSTDAGRLRQIALSIGEIVVLPTGLLVLFVIRWEMLFSGPPDTLVRPILIALATGAGLGAISALLIRRRPLSDIVAASAAALVVSIFWAFGVLLIVLASVIASELLRRRQWVPLHASRILAAGRTFVIVAMVVTVVSMPLNGVIALGDFKMPPSRTDSEGPQPPNIYIFLLDAYAREDTLRESFGLDNSPFLARLRTLGFDVYDAATANYNATELTLLTMFSGAYVDEISSLRPTPENGASQARAARRALASAPLLVPIRRHGYEFIVVQPPMVHVRFPGADRGVDAGGITDLEVSLLANTAAGRLGIAAMPDFILDDQRRRVLDSLSAVADIADDAGPHFVLTHLMVPHQPFLWSAKGRPLDAPPCFPGCELWEGDTDRFVADHPDFAERYAGQVVHLNRLLEGTVRSVVASDPEAVVILMGDHGSRLDKGDLREPFRIFFSARSPGHPRLFGDAPSLINVIPAFLRVYLGEQLSDRRSRYYLVPDLRRVLETAPVGQ